MKAGFALTNPMVTGIDWSFVLEVSEVIAVEGEVAQGVEEGEVTGTVRVPKEVVIIDELEQPEILEQPTNDVPNAPTSQYTFPDQLD